MISWQRWQFREDFPKSLLLILIILGTSICAYFFGGHWIFFLLATATLFGTLIRYFLPTEYTLREDGIEEHFLGKKIFKKWALYKNLYPHSDGVFLSTFEKPSFLDPFRGKYIRFNKNKVDKNVIISFIKNKIGTH